MTPFLSSAEELSNNSTWKFYEDHAERYVKDTVAVDMSEVYFRFERFLPKGASVLDAGSGSGRDTKYFLENGYAVVAFDYSSKLASISSQFTGVKTEIRSFMDVNERDEYDGIWACASMLHLPKNEILDNLERLARALKLGGVIYMSFRYGETERCDSDGRCYSDIDETSLKKIMKRAKYLEIQDVWTSLGEGAFKGSGKWLNAIAKRVGEFDDV